MNASKTYKIGLVLMLLLNAVLLYLLLQRPGGPPPHRGSSHGLMEEISSKLEFSEAQKTSFADLALTHRKQMRALEDKQKNWIKIHFSYLKGTPSGTREEIEKSEAALTQLEHEKLALTFNHFEKVKLICSQDQKARFESIIDQIVAVLADEENNMPPPPRGR